MDEIQTFAQAEASTPTFAQAEAATPTFAQAELDGTQAEWDQEVANAQAEVDFDAYYEDYAMEEFDDWKPEAGFCDDYVLHDAHSYVALNGNVYRCAGVVQADLDYLEAMENQPPCEHGLSASLCAGPNHYPADNRY